MTWLGVLRWFGMTVTTIGLLRYYQLLFSASRSDALRWREQRRNACLVIVIGMVPLAIYLVLR